MSDDKNIYVAINIYDLKQILKLPKEVDEMIRYLEIMKPNKWDYQMMRKGAKDFYKKYKSFLE